MPSFTGQLRSGLRYFFTEQLMAGFAGGLNLRDAPTELKPTESPNCWNVTLDERGGVVKRLGYTKWNASAVGNKIQDSYYSQLTGLLFWYSPADGKLYSDPGTGVLTLRHTFTSGSRVSLVDFAGKVYTSHPVDGLYESADGVTWAATSKGAHTTDIPKGSLCAVWQNKLWIAGDPGNITRVWFSAPGDATDWDSGDNGGSVDVREKDDSAIVALHGGTGFDFQATPGLLVFKRDSMYRINDSDTGSYQTVDSNVGAASKNAIVDLFGEAIFVSRRGIYMTKKVTAAVAACEQLLPLWDPDSSDDTSMSNWCAGYNGDRVYFSIQRIGASSNDLAITFAPLYGWATTGSNAMSCYQTRTGTQSEILIGSSPSVAGQLYKLNDGGSDDGTDIQSWFETRWYQVTNGHEARMNLARFLMRGQDLTITVFKNFEESGVEETLSSSNADFLWNGTTWGGGQWNGVSIEDYISFFPRNVGRAFKIRIDETSSLTYTTPDLLDSGASLVVGGWALYGIETQYATLGLS